MCCTMLQHKYTDSAYRAIDRCRCSTPPQHVCICHMCCLSRFLQHTPMVFDEPWEVCAKEPVQKAVSGHRVEEEQNVGSCSPPKRLRHTAKLQQLSCCCHHISTTMPMAADIRGHANTVRLHFHAIVHIVQVSDTSTQAPRTYKAPYLDTANSYSKSSCLHDKAELLGCYTHAN